MSPPIAPNHPAPPRSTVEWLWRPYVARGKLTLLDGDPGCGKSLVTLDLAARLSCGASLPDDSGPAAPCRSLLLSIEDDADDTIWPRLRAAGADLRQLFVAGANGNFAQLPDILPALEEKIRELGIGLLILDALTTLLPAELASGSAAAVRQVVAPIIQMAIETNIAVVLVRHLTKGSQSRAVCRGLGSIGVAGLARTVLLAGPHPTDASARALTVVKSNLAAIPAPLGYRIGERDGVAVVEWLGPATAGLCAAEQTAPPADAPGVVRATIWLLEALADGPRPAAELLLAAEDSGLCERTLEKAKKQLRVVSKFTHSSDGRCLWYWCP